MKKIDNYFDAVHYLNNNFILFNDIYSIDPDFMCDSLLGDFYVKDEDGLDDYMIDIHQTFLTDCSQSDAEYLSNRFGLLFAYSPALDMWVLCVPHFGTMWKGVSVEDNIENMNY